MMKIYPLIYTNEAARTAEEALSKGIAAISKDRYRGETFDSEIGDENIHNVVLVSVDRAISVLRTLEKSGWTSDEFHPDLSKQIGKHIAQRAIVGMLDYSQVEEDLWDVNFSAGVASFGPLAYQIGMYETGGWLMSDESLKPASQTVWQKMYQLSDKGVYQRKFLGEWGDRYLLDRLDIGPGRTHLEEYASELRHGSFEVDEQTFLDYLQDRNLKPQSYGWLWAYEKTSSDPKIKDMFAKGNQLIRFLVEKYPNFSEQDMAELFEEAGANFFNRMYGGPASYQE